MTRKATRRRLVIPLPPRGLRPKLCAAQVSDLAICHLEMLDGIAHGDTNEETLWQVVAAALTWSKVAEMLQVGEAEMLPQLELASTLTERYGRTGRVVYSGTEYQLAKAGVEVMDELASLVDDPTARIAAEWSERKVNELAAQCRANIRLPEQRRAA